MISAGRVQFFVVLIMTVGAAIATWQFSAAGSAWQDSVRQEIRHSAALQEDVRFVYADEAPLAFRAATAGVRADRLREVRPSSRLAVSEYTLASQTAFGLTSRAAPDSLLGDRELADGDLGYNVPRRLAEVRAREPALRDVDPDLPHAAADRYAFRGGVTALIVAVFAVAVAGVRLRFGATLRLVAWVLLVVLPLAGLWMAAQQQRAQALARISAQLVRRNLHGRERSGSCGLCRGCLVAVSAGSVNRAYCVAGFSLLNDSHVILIRS